MGKYYYYYDLYKSYTTALKKPTSITDFLLVLENQTLPFHTNILFITVWRKSFKITYFDF